MHRILRTASPLCILSLFVATGCATSPPPRMGKISDLSTVDDPHAAFCAHKVPEKVCAKCHPELAGKFKAVDDWCPEHDVPESQCFACHPDLTFTPLPKLPSDADFKHLSLAGEDVPSLAAHAVAGKLTIFDFWADWCAPCREIDRHVYALLGTRKDIAYRKLNMVSWETPLTKHYLTNTATLPHLIVFGKDGSAVGTLTGLDIPALDALIAKAAR